MKSYYSILNEAFDRLDEAKQDEANFESAFGPELKDRFLKQKQRMKSPENDFYYWIGMKNEKGDEAIEKLEVFLTELENKLTNRQKRAVAEEGAEVVYEDADWKVLHITTYEAAAKYGEHTKWCITGRYPNNRTAERGKHFFDNYLANNYKGYYFFIRKDGSDMKYCVCPLKNGRGFDVYNPVDDEIGYVPGGPDVSGIPELRGLDVEGELEEPDLYEPEDAESEEEGENDDNWENEEEEEEENPEWTDEDGNVHPGYAPREPQDPELIPVQNPNEMEFKANSREEAVRKFAEISGFEGVEVVGELPNNLMAVHFRVEPKHEEQTYDDGYVFRRDIPGDRYTALVFIPGEGAGPLMAQVPNGFAIPGFRSLESLQNQFGAHGHMAQVEIQHNNGEHERLGMPEEQEESLEEGFYYYIDNTIEEDDDDFDMYL